MRFSVILPAKNEEAYIGAAVASLARQSVPRAEYEIVVVDNNSDDGTSRAAREAGADRVILEQTPGTNFARQRGVRESTGAIVAFLDADSEAPEDWLVHIERNLSREGVVATSGPYDQGFTGITKILDKLYMHFVMRHIPEVLHFFFRRKAGMLIGGNFGVHRWALERIGGLPKLKFYGDDGATAMLLSRFAGTVLYDPTLMVKSAPRRYTKHLLGPVLRYAWVYLGVYFSPDYRKLPETEK
jgi:glycosyltransferase involved in cell wall biosynthesis